MIKNEILTSLSFRLDLDVSRKSKTFFFPFSPFSRNKFCFDPISNQQPPIGLSGFFLPTWNRFNERLCTRNYNYKLISRQQNLALVIEINSMKDLVINLYQVELFNLIYVLYKTSIIQKPWARVGIQLGI